MNRGHPVLTGLVCVILFVALAAASAVGILQHVVSEQAISDAISEMVRTVDVEALVEELEIYERITELVDEEIVEAVGITPEVISEFLDSTPVRNFVAGSVSEIINAFVQGESSIVITQADVMQLVRDNVPYVEERFGITIDEQYLVEIESILERSEVPESIVIELPELEEIAPELGLELDVGIDLDNIRWLLQPSTLYTLVGVVAVLLIVIVLTNIFRLRIALLGTGVAAIISGVVFLLIGLSVVTLFRMFIENDLHRQIISGLLSQVQAATLQVAAAQLIAGAVLAISFAITRAVKA